MVQAKKESKWKDEFNRYKRGWNRNLGEQLGRGDKMNT